jgi:predicted nucleic acid-binding protein
LNDTFCLVTSALLESHGQPGALRIKNRLQVCTAHYLLDVIGNHIHIVRENQPTRTHERQKFIQVIDVAAFVGVDERNVDRFL